jgi:hypothetical protein
MSGDEQDLQRDPGRPRDVQGRHRGVEVGRDGRRLLSDVGHDGRIDEAGARDQSWRGHGKQPEHEESDRVDPDKGVAGRTVRDRVAPVDPQQNDQRHREVHHLVVPARQQLPAGVLAQRVVHRRLDLDVQPRLGRQEALPVRDRLIGTGGCELADPVVHENKQEDDDDLPHESGTLGTCRGHDHGDASGRVVKMSFANGRDRTACRCTNHSFPRTSRNSGGGRRRKKAMVRSVSSVLA